MNKLELISTLKEKANLTKSEAAEIIKIFRLLQINFLIEVFLHI